MDLTRPAQCLESHSHFFDFSAMDKLISMFGQNFNLFSKSNFKSILLPDNAYEFKLQRFLFSL